jgi:hypothetical protein
LFGRDRAVSGARCDPGLLANRHRGAIFSGPRPFRRPAPLVRARRPRPGRRAGAVQWPRRSEIGADVKTSRSCDRPSSRDLVGAISDVVV